MCFLIFFKRMSPAIMLDLAQLTMEMILFLLLTGQRGPSVHIMDLENIFWDNKRIAILFEDLFKNMCIKTSSSRKITKILYWQKNMCCSLSLYL